MADRETVHAWLEICGKNHDCSGTCPYSKNGFGEYGQCRDKLMEDALELLKEQPQQKTGHWIQKSVVNMFGGMEMECSVCGHEIIRTELEHFCNYYGAKMDEVLMQNRPE